MNLTIRRACITDFEAVVSMLYFNYNYPNYSENKVASVNDCSIMFINGFNGNGFINIVEDDGVAVAAFSHAIRGNNLVEMHMCMNPEYIGKGIGSKVFELNSGLCTGLTLFTMAPETNPLSIKALIDANFKVAGSIPDSYQTSDGFCSRVVLYSVCK
jgi:hypothetical protein